MSKKEIYHTEKVTGNVNARPTTSEEVSYRNGYVDGQMTENYQQNRLKTRDNNNATGGLLLGIFLTVAIGLVAGIFYTVFSQQQKTIDTPPISEEQQSNKEMTIIERTKEIVPVPVISDQTPEQQQPDKETTIIEKTKEVIPVPVQQQPEASSSEPKVEVNIPSPVQQNPPEPQSSTNQNPPENETPINSATNETVAPPQQ